MKKKLFVKYSMREFIIIALLASLGIAVKPVISPFFKAMTGPFMLPGGVLAGGVFMIFPVLASGLTRGRISATLASIVQAVLVLATGVGSQGIISLVTYIAPGMAVDLVMLLFEFGKQPQPSAVSCFFACMAANMTGSFLVMAAIFDIPPVPLMLSVCTAALSGGLGGLLAWWIAKRLKKLNVLKDL
jgi:ABC-type thiamin/hydroxymethylpyrimidine transport system permease subunit